MYITTWVAKAAAVKATHELQVSLTKIRIEIKISFTKQTLVWIEPDTQFIFKMKFSKAISVKCFAFTCLALGSFVWQIWLPIDPSDVA